MWTDGDLLPDFQKGILLKLFCKFQLKSPITHAFRICRKDPSTQNFGPKTHLYGHHIPTPSICHVLPLGVRTAITIVQIKKFRKIFKILFNRPFSCSGKESESNDVVIQFEEFSNVHNGDRASNATRSNFTYKIV